ncbi:MAG TPA: hypothetical protein VGE97_08070 [Nitrososphaera sp.]|jgi:hypothetical protein
MNIETIYKIDEVTVSIKGTEKPRDNSKRRDFSGSISNSDDDADDKDYGSDNNSNDILQDAYELAKRSNWSIDFALYVIYCRAKAAGDDLRAERCMRLLEQKFMNALAADHDDLMFLNDKKRNDEKS